MNRTSSILFAAVAIMTAACSSSEHMTQGRSNTSAKADTFVVMSYNVENFFHCQDDSLKNDDDFTPDGAYHWNYTKMEEKAQRIKKVIMAANGHNYPAVVGLCEVEGLKAVNYLLYQSGLNQCGYKALCYPTPDRRGIAVAMLYDANRVTLIDSKAINVSIADSSFLTRDVLYAKLQFETDTFHVFVNHWPSKYGGVNETIWKREHVARQLRSFCDSITSADAQAKMILVGDFNDTAEAPAIADVFGAKSEGTDYINLSGDTESSSYKYRGDWGTIDHIIVSKNLCNVNRPLFKVCNLWFIEENDDRFGGLKPFRTYIGQEYHGGFSDHFPVLVKIIR